MTPRFKGKPNFDLTYPCPLCGHKIQPWEIKLISSDLLRCPACHQTFDQMCGRKPLTTS